MPVRPSVDAPHCLVIAFYFPPARASGVYRARALANHLAQAGWRVTVVAADSDFFRCVLDQADESLTETIAPEVEVVRVPFEDPRFDRRLRFHGWVRGNFPRFAESRLRSRAERRFPDPYALWIDPAVAAIGSASAGNRPDVVVATGNPFSSFEVARAAATSLGVPYVLDYRDSWTLDQFAGIEAFPSESPVWQAEAAVLRDAARVVFVNSAQQSWHAERYPTVANRMRAIENGFDPELLGSTESSSTANAPLRLGYVGTITKHLPWSELFQAWRLLESSSLLADSVIELYGHLGFFSHNQESVASLLTPGQEAGRVQYCGPLAKREVGPTYRQLDILLLVTPSSRYVTCQKVYEYMAFGKPIVSVNGPMADARGPLQGYPLSFEPDCLEPSSIADALQRAAMAAQEDDREIREFARDYAGRFAREQQMKQFRSLLEEVAGG